MLIKLLQMLKEPAVWTFFVVIMLRLCILKDLFDQMSKKLGNRVTIIMILVVFTLLFFFFNAVLENNLW